MFYGKTKKKQQNFQNNYWSFERASKKRIQYRIGKWGSKFFLIKEYDVVIDTISNKIGIIVHITDGDVKKGFKKQYLFEPDDHSFVPVFRYYEQLKRNEWNKWNWNDWVRGFKVEDANTLW